MNIKLTFDPTKHHTRLSKNEIIQACGVLPLWAANPFLLSTPLQQAFEAQYLFPMSSIENGILTPLGVFQYPMGDIENGILTPLGVFQSPNDPTLYPLIKLERGPEILFIYQYALVAIIKADGSTFVTRMD